MLACCLVDRQQTSLGSLLLGYAGVLFGGQATNVSGKPVASVFRAEDEISLHGVTFQKTLISIVMPA
jgi:hypothetical protein